jgi:hypothetical protein
MSKQIRGSLLRHLYSRSFDGYDTLLIDCFTVFVEVNRFPLVDTLHCGDVVVATVNIEAEIETLEIIRRSLVVQYERAEKNAG